MELSGSNMKKFLIFSYISGNGNPKKSLFYLQKWNPALLSPGSKNLKKKSTPRKFPML